VRYLFTHNNVIGVIKKEHESLGSAEDWCPSLSTRRMGGSPRGIEFSGWPPPSMSRKIRMIKKIDYLAESGPGVFKKTAGKGRAPDH
jgi:hypothetical protein